MSPHEHESGRAALPRSPLSIHTKRDREITAQNNVSLLQGLEMDLRLVTGGAGFIGSNLIRHVINRPEVSLLVNLDCLTYAGHLENLSGYIHRWWRTKSMKTGKK